MDSRLPRLVEYGGKHFRKPLCLQEPYSVAGRVATSIDAEASSFYNIIFPTNAYIGATELIKLRCVPILIMGVSNKPVYVDQYLNTPLDFWAHDIQHSKRQIQETLRYYDCYIKHSEYYQRRVLFNII